MKNSPAVDLDRVRSILDALLLGNPWGVDRFDASYLDDFPFILKERFKIESVKDVHIKECGLVAELYAILGVNSSVSFEGLVPLLRASGIREEDYTPKRSTSPDLQSRFRCSEMKNFDQVKGVQLKGTKNVLDHILSFQEEYSRKLEKKFFGLFHLRKDRKFFDLGRDETGDPWTPMMTNWLREKVFSSDEAVLILGPRWAGEVKYFREKIGFTNAIGLDLFSHDTELVKTGDMHKMPFPDSHFGVIYQRNTFDKAYDIRTVLKECVRVLKPNGVLISDDCLGYTYGVDEAGRTSMKSNEWVLRFLGESVSDVLYNRETKTKEDWFERIGQIAVRIRK